MKKNIVITSLITFFIIGVLFLSCSTKRFSHRINTYYQVYLNGNKIGVIDNQKELYALINDSQTSIKEKYNVDTVYPPTNLKIIEANTYNDRLDDVKSVYDKIETQDDFAILGYQVTIRGEEETFSVYVLDKEIFYNAAKRFVRAFLNQEEYDKYINNTQEEIVETGRIIEDMKFKEKITIKESYISVKDKIYTDEADLVHFLLFGSNPNTKNYTIKLGDTIESISNDNELNPEEFLIANTQYKSQNTVLKVGEKVNVTLIEPQLTFIYTLKEIYNQVEFFEKEREPDETRYVGWSEVKTPGVNGINRYQEEYVVENGEREQGAEPTLVAVIKPVQNQVVAYGTKKYYSSGGYIPENPVDTSGYWAWPTNRGYVITSYRGWRWGRMHQGIDISGAGNFNSPIYSVGDGVVEYVFNGCPSRGNGYGDTCGGSLGNQIRINHGNGYVTVYGHLHQNVLVRVGQTVSRGQRIGSMGNSGSSTGVHLHFEVKVNNVNIDPLRLYR